MAKSKPKLSDRQKSNLIAKWKTGQYTKVSLAKAYKVSEAYVRKVIGGIDAENADIVEASVIVEDAKRCVNSSIEKNAIEQAVKYKLEKIYTKDNNKVKVFDVTSKLLDKVNGILDKGTVPEKVNVGAGVQQIEPRELNADDMMKLQNTTFKAGETLGVIEKPSTNLTLANQNNIGNEETHFQIEFLEPKQNEKTQSKQ